MTERALMSAVVRRACGVGVLLALIAIVAAPAPPAVAQEPAIVDLDSDPAANWLGTHHFGVFRGDARVGWVRRSLERVEWREQPAVRRTLETFVSIAGDGNARRTTERVTYLLEEPQLLVEIARHVESQGRTGGRRATRNGARFDVVTERDGEEETGAVAALSILLADELVTERTVHAALSREEGPVGALGSAVALDLVRMRLIKRIVSVRATEEAEDGSTLYHVGVATGPDTWSEPVVVDDAGAIVRGPLGGGLTIRRMSEAEARSALDVSSVEVADRIRMDARLGDLLTLRELAVSMPAPAADKPAPFPDTGRQTTEVRDGRLYLRVRTDVDAGEVSAAEREAALEPSELIDSESAVVVAAVDRALIGTSRPAVRVRRLLEFTAQHLADAVVMTEPKASELLRSRRGDCTEHTRLFVALCRAAGIPAREVTGVVWIDDEQRTFGWHAWAEVELNGRWRPVDPTGGVTPAHAAHIRIDPAARAAGVLANVRFDLVEAVR